MSNVTITMTTEQAQETLLAMHERIVECHADRNKHGKDSAVGIICTRQIARCQKAYEAIQKAIDENPPY